MPFAFRLDDATGKVFNVYDTPEFKKSLLYYKDLAESRVCSKSVVNSKNKVWQNEKAEKVASLKGNLESLGFQFVEAQRDLERSNRNGKFMERENISLSAWNVRFDDQKVKNQLANIGNIMIRYGVNMAWFQILSREKSS